jgi:hypothetical protein
MDDLYEKYAAHLQTVRECEIGARNASQRDRQDVADVYRRRAAELRGNLPAGAQERLRQFAVEFWGMLQAYESILSEKHGRTVKASRTRPKIKRVGIIQTTADMILNGGNEGTQGFRTLIDSGRTELAAESLVLRYPEYFAEDVLNMARGRLAARAPSSSGS